MTNGSTRSKRCRPVEAPAANGRDHQSNAPCTHQFGVVHPVAANGHTICPRCLPAIYADHHALHRGEYDPGESFQYLTTEAHGITR